MPRNIDVCLRKEEGQKPMLGRQSLIVMVAGCGGLVMVACMPQNNPGAVQPAQCPAGQYFNGQYCQPPQGPAPVAPAPTVAAPAPAPAPAAPPIIATAAPSGPSATPLDPNAAQAVTVLLGPLAQQQAMPGARAVGPAIAGNFQQGQALETQLQMNPGKCYTVVGVGLPPVQNLDLQLVPAISIPGVPPPIAAADNTQSSTAVIGGKPNCYKWPFPIAGNMKLTVTVSQGQGVAAAQVYEK